jgi:hypothetical protein
LKVILGIFIGILSVVVVLVLVAGYFGFVPGVSKIFGSDKPVDLGVTYTAADNASGHAKGGMQILTLPAGTPPQQSLVFSGTKPASFNLTQQEVTAMINNNQWAYLPVSDIQVRFNADNTAEWSGILNLDKLHDYALARGLSEADYNDALAQVSKYAIIQMDMPFYVKGTGAVVNGQITFNCDSLKIGRLPVELADQINSHHNDLLTLLQNDVLTIPGFTCKNLSISNGQLHFDGTLPQSVSMVTK